MRHSSLVSAGIRLAYDGGVTLRQLQRECASKRTEYLIARQVYAEVTRLAVADRTALERELQQAMLEYYRVHGALHEQLRARGRSTPRLH